MKILPVGAWFISHFSQPKAYLDHIVPDRSKWESGPTTRWQGAAGGAAGKASNEVCPQKYQRQDRAENNEHHQCTLVEP